MPYELTWEDRGALSRFWDVVTDDDFVQCNLDESSDPRFERIKYSLVIFSESVVFEASSTAVRRVAAMDVMESKRNPNLVIAIVATQALIRGFANMYRLQHEGMGGPWKTRYFETEEEARRWLTETLD